MGESKTVENALRISTKHALEICPKIKGNPLQKAKRFLNNLLAKKIGIKGKTKGKYYTNAAKNILSVLNAAEANAKQKNLNVEKLFVKQAKADKGYKFIRPKTRAKFAGRKAKMTNITIILEER